MYRPRSLSRLISTSNMSSFTLYGARGSTNTNRVRLTLAEGGFTNFELVFLDLAKGEQKVSDVVSNIVYFFLLSMLTRLHLVCRPLHASSMGKSPSHNIPRWVHTLRKPRYLQIFIQKVFVPSSALRVRSRGYSTL
jgi:hypothetical protein